MNYLNVLNSILDDKIDNADYLVRDYISEYNIEALEYYIDYFKDIPEKDIHKIFKNLLTLIFEYEKYPYVLDYDKIKTNSKKQVLFELRDEEILKTENKIREESENASENKINELIDIKKDYITKSYKKEGDKLKGEKPTVIIKKDLKIIKDLQKQIINFQQMAERLYGTKSKKTDEWFFFNVPEEIYDTYMKNKTIIQNNKKLIYDLENKEFNIISKYNYYEFENPSKTPIKEYLESIRKKYSLENVSQTEQCLVNELKKDCL